VFVAFLIINLAIGIGYDACDVRKSKKDCGYPGISSLECMTTQCFMAGGGQLEKKTVHVTRKQGTKFGFVSGSSRESRYIFIQDLKEGALADHNARVGPEEQILPRDTILTVGGFSGQSMRKELGDVVKKNVTFEIARTKLPASLRWLARPVELGPSLAERLITSRGGKKWLDTFSRLGGLGFSMWYMSGYPITSLPLYYFGTAGFMSWWVSRCCHNSEVSEGTPHCYVGGTANFSVAMKRIQKRADTAMTAFKKDPRTYAMAYLWSPEFTYEKWLQ